MIDHQRDLANVFYGADFAASFIRRRPATSDLRLRAIVGTVDDEVLEGRAIAAARIARLPASWDVQVGDLLIARERIDADTPAGTAFRVLDRPHRVVDGNERELLLGSATP
jgi:hypothetical protein